MYFRFGTALVLAVVVALAGIAIEKRCLTLRRALTRDQYRYEVLRDLYARQRLQTQQLGAPARLFEALETEHRESIARSRGESNQSRDSRFAWDPGDRKRQ
jgi:hypothetical protein